MEEVFELEFASSDDGNDDRPTAPLHKLYATVPATRLVLPKLRQCSGDRRSQEDENICLIDQ
jgi:hypothetical protein